MQLSPLLSFSFLGLFQRHTLTSAQERKIQAGAIIWVVKLYCYIWEVKPFLLREIQNCLLPNEGIDKASRRDVQNVYHIFIQQQVFSLCFVLLLCCVFPRAGSVVGVNELYGLSVGNSH